MSVCLRPFRSITNSCVDGLTVPMVAPCETSTAGLLAITCSVAAAVAAALFATMLEESVRNVPEAAKSTPRMIGTAWLPSIPPVKEVTSIMSTPAVEASTVELPL